MIEGWELFLLLIIVMVLLFFGPTKLPELAKGLGRAWGEFRLARKQVERELAQEREESGPAVREPAEDGY